MISSLFMILQATLTMKHIKYGRAIPFLLYNNQLASGANVTLAAIAPEKAIMNETLSTAAFM